MGAVRGHHRSLRGIHALTRRRSARADPAHRDQLGTRTERRQERRIFQVRRVPVLYDGLLSKGVTMRNPVELEAPVLPNALLAGGPAADRAEKMMLYGQFVGSWDGRVVVHEAAGTRRESSSEVHFGWVLGGRAVQDVLDCTITRRTKAHRAGSHVRHHAARLRSAERRSGTSRGSIRCGRPTIG